MPRHIDADYDAIRRALLEMGGVVEEMIERAGRALAERDAEMAKDVIRTDPKVDVLEKQIDESCHEMLARQQPMAADLRLLIAVLKITTDLERIGDLASNMGRYVRDLASRPDLPDTHEIQGLFDAARQMVAGALDAFMRSDAHLALEVWQRDDTVDEGYKAFFEDLVTRTGREPAGVEPFFQLLLIARALERVADHATNIAEDVIYLVQGVDIRHTGKKEDPASV